MLVTVGDVGIVNGVVPVLLLTSQTGNLVNCFNNASLEHEGKALGTHSSPSNYHKIPFVVTTPLNVV